ncbi:SRPBCC family protein [Pimelobacter simplex]|uniref:SRPBCC family protein n=1 Tax=Nocardioides simplex TaxID=2045 RepID=UPI00215017C5|nr:SRPBCC family protein [Pimelobacter simplex]UUW88546.1 SRPBCC family protein [Pimelobacter simplex]UUW98051.1 SRPBCC family protein [Pimelobacter simplex]
MSTETTTPETLIEADPDVPTVRMVREFDAPRELVFRAHVEPELVKQWMGPDSIGMDIDVWDIRTGGEYRYTATREGEEIAHFYGAVHRVNENEKIVQTFGFEEMPDAVSLDTMVFVELPGGRTRIEALSVVYDFESRAGMLASGMEVGVNEGYAALDRLLARLVAETGR